MAGVVRQPPREAGRLVVQPVKLPGDTHSETRATRSMSPALQVGGIIWVRISGYAWPEEWIRGTITAVGGGVTPTEVQPDE